jgi:flagellar M-ring protein FliF
MVDGTYIKNHQTGKMEYQARSKDELEKIENLVKVAIGYNDDRNDRVEVISMPFVNYFEETIENKNLWLEENIMPILKTCIIAISTLLVAIFVIRPIFIKLIEAKKSPDPLVQEQQNANLEDELEAIRNASSKSEIKTKFKNITDAVKGYPEESLVVIRQWLNKG